MTMRSAWGRFYGEPVAFLEDGTRVAESPEAILERLRAIVELWPKRLAELDRIDIADRRNRLLE